MSGGASAQSNKLRFGSLKLPLSLTKEHVFTIARHKDVTYFNELIETSEVHVVTA
jgi:hypothetical protein